ncbi:MULTISPECIES: methyltransferase domain-containing protein [unclassified Saccharopolyspora]|uniref:methyltransferase domain-containing protein n=1 Tax=unclassified Saccharopolyspora TaxID=2646250 RepID=UPI001CD23E2A|nr:MULTISPECIES: methyltransferase domain-containing protein [unclassified Saccharopolyspora]MCA1188928.1 methyltransferase domain-containing protein [Saccharopolyspora sp. 6T]MCA1226765.1 methyltransferase domain-containing protein [Saccharopolyspora sp. 6M]MCA1282032.1 methyltransferase domain-containing protein [Saccharopolyspora sp. 7B]
MADVYTHGHHESVLRSHRWRTAENSAAYLLADLTPGAAVLDVGCGPGTITHDFAERVAPGHVTGVDNAAEIVEQASAGAPANTEFQVADVYALPFADGSFDVVHAHQVLQHLTDPVAALREMRRVCRPGGIVAARDADYAAMTWYPQLPALTDWLDLYHRVARGNDAEPDAGRRLLGWAREAGFGEVDATASAWCFATAEERTWWGGLWADRVRNSAFATQAVERGLATGAELERLSAGWREWIDADVAWFAVLNGEIRCHR